jgi:hypothetical protein
MFERTFFKAPPFLIVRSLDEICDAHDTEGCAGGGKTHRRARSGKGRETPRGDIESRHRTGASEQEKKPACPGV